jgi:hypothetical protein
MISPPPSFPLVSILFVGDQVEYVLAIHLGLGEHQSAHRLNTGESGGKYHRIGNKNVFL